MEMKSKEKGPSLNSVDEVTIDNNVVGRPAKFILVKVTFGKESKVVFRASRLNYHDDIYKEFLQVTGNKFETTVMGGGRIEIKENGDAIKLFGMSTKFGIPDFKVAEELLHIAYPKAKISIVEPI
jgi:hypothetical protein